MLLGNLFKRNLCYYQLLPLTKKENVRYLPFQVASGEPLQKEPLLLPAATSHREGERKVPTLSSCFWGTSAKETSASSSCLPLTKRENVRYLPFQVASAEPLQKEPLLLPAATSHKEGERKVPTFKVASREPLPGATSHKEGERKVPTLSSYFWQTSSRRNLCYYQLLPLTERENVRYLPFQVASGEPLQKEPLLLPAATSHKDGERKVPTLSSCFWGTSAKETSATTSCLPLTKKENVRYLPFQVASGEPLQREPLLLPAATSHKEGDVRYLPFQVASGEPLQKEPLLLPAATSHREGERKVPTLSSCFWGTSSKGTSATTSCYLSQRRRTEGTYPFKLLLGNLCKRNLCF